VIRILQETPTTPDHVFLPVAAGRFVNNLVWFDRGRVASAVNVGPGTDAASFRFAGNLWYAHDDPARSQPVGLPSVDTASIVGRDPRLADASAGDASIPGSSPAAGAGVPIEGIAADFAGRCWRNPPSIGAFEAAR
jgi:hypothetical protein